MLPKTLVFLALLGLLSVFPAIASAAVEEQEMLPDFSLPLPADGDHKSYLGLSDFKGKTFTVADIDADIVLIELFSMYCPYCQREAPNVNKLYGKMQELSPDSPKVLIIGIGASNSEFEVDHFRSSFDIQFPLFPDKDMAIYQALQGSGTPGFIAVHLQKGKLPVIILRNSGGFDDAGDFLTDLIQAAGL